MEDWKAEIRDALFVRDVSRLDIPKAQAARDRNIPSRLYKYRTVSDFSLQNFEFDSLYCAFPSSFNDPYDSMLSFDPFLGKDWGGLLAENSGLSEGSISQILASEDPLRSLVGEVYGSSSKSSSVSEEDLYEFVKSREGKLREILVSAMNRVIRDGYKVCSLSERLDSVLMWSHYAGNHTGFAMEYDFNRTSSSFLTSISLWPVFYKNELLDISEYLPKEVGKPWNNLVGVMAALHKAEDWSYEREWRIVIPDSASGTNHNFRVPSPTAVYVGSRCPEESIDKICKIARRKQVSVYRMKHSSSCFEMTDELIQS